MNFKSFQNYLISNYNNSGKYYAAIVSVLLVSSLHVIFFENNDKYDVYLFYNHERFLTNILYDIGNIYAANVFTYILTKYKKQIFTPIFYTTLAMWATYFLFYHQLASLILILFYLCIAIVLQLKRKKK